MRQACSWDSRWRARGAARLCDPQVVGDEVRRECGILGLDMKPGILQRHGFSMDLKELIPAEIGLRGFLPGLRAELTEQELDVSVGDRHLMDADVAGEH